MTNSQAITIPGPAGSIEARLDCSTDGTAAAVLAHPHPQYGGTMFDGVLGVAAGILDKRGAATLRFNFRSVGASEGRFDNGVGEVDDVQAAVDWIERECAPSSISIVGYSFGANVAWRALEVLPPLARIVLIAPPVGMMEFPVRADLTCPVHAIVGTRDDFVKLDALASWAAACGEVQVHEIAGADHFFGGYYEELGKALEVALG